VIVRKIEFLRGDARMLIAILVAAAVLALFILIIAVCQVRREKR